MTLPPPADRSQGGDGRARQWLELLESRLAQHMPAWTRRGPEDPARVLLEVVASTIDDLRQQVDDLPSRALPEVLSRLREESAWPAPARWAIALVAKKALDRAVRIPAGTAVTTSRKIGGDAGGARRITFELEADGWLSPARLKRAVTVHDERTEELPSLDLRGRDDREALESRPAVTVFDRTGLERHLYVGDPSWARLARRVDEIVLEWQEPPPFILEGRWEYFVRGSWRLLPVEFEMTVDSGGEDVVRMRIRGPLPDLAWHAIEGAMFPWLRLELPGSGKISCRRPRLVWLPPDPSSRTEPKGGAIAPRAIARTFSRLGGRWQDHSFGSEEGIDLAPGEASDDPTVYLGWDRPLPASLFWDGEAGRPGPEDVAVKLAWEHSGADGFQSLEVDDRTEGLTRAGTISWRLPARWTASELFGERLYWIRARWTDGAYLEPPTLRCLYPDAVGVVEGRTLRDRILELEFEGARRTARVGPMGEGDWLPFATVELEAGHGRVRRLRRVDGTVTPGEGEFQLRRRADSTVEIEVSDPPSGKVRARIPAVRVGVGQAAGGRAVRLDVLESRIDGLQEVLTVGTFHAGRPAEGRDEFLRRLRGEWKSGDRAVTGEDFRRLVQACDEGIRRVEVVASDERPGELWVVVFGKHPCGPGRISTARLDRLARYLEPKVVLGTKVRVVEACYVPYWLEIVPEEKPGDETPVPRIDVSSLTESIRSFLDPLTGGPDQRGYPLGRGLHRQDLETIISCSRLGVEGTKLGAFEWHIHASGSRQEPAGWESGGGHLEIPVLDRVVLSSDDRDEG